MGNTKLQFSVAEILGEHKKFSHHKRPLLNAESLFYKNNPKSSLELFNRILKKIPHPEIRDKIARNIEIIQSTLQINSSTQKSTAKQGKRASKTSLFDPSKNLKDLEQLARSLIQRSRGEKVQDNTGETSVAEPNSVEESLSPTTPTTPPTNTTPPQRESPASSSDHDSRLNSPFLYEFNVGEEGQSSATTEPEPDDKGSSSISSASIENIQSAQIQTPLTGSEGSESQTTAENTSGETQFTVETFGGDEGGIPFEPSPKTDLGSGSFDSLATNTLSSEEQKSEEITTSGLSSEQQKSEEINTSDLNSEQQKSEEINTSDLSSEQQKSEEINTSDLSSQQQKSEEINTSGLSSEQQKSDGITTGNLNSEQQKSEEITTDSIGSQDTNLQTENKEGGVNTDSGLASLSPTGSIDSLDAENIHSQQQSSQELSTDEMSSQEAQTGSQQARESSTEANAGFTPSSQVPEGIFSPAPRQSSDSTYPSLPQSPGSGITPPQTTPLGLSSPATNLGEESDSIEKSNDSIGDAVAREPSETPGIETKSDMGMPGAFQNLNVYNPLNELLSDLYFSKDWERYKQLPVRDRRGGRDRRKKQIKLPPGMRDRRAGKDRRVRDLFAEREDFLADWEESKKESKQENFPSNIFEPKTVADLFPSGMVGPYSGYAPSGGENPGQPVYDGESQDDLQEALQGIESLQQDKAQMGDSGQQPPSYPTPPQTSDYPPENYQDKSRPANEEYIKEEDEERGLIKINLPDPIGANDYEISVLQGHLREISLPSPEDILRQQEYDRTESERPDIEELPTPEIDILEGGLTEQSPYAEDSDEPGILDEESEEGEGVEEVEESKGETEERMIHGVLELKPPEADDAPFLTLTYDFTKIPHSFKLSKNYSIMEYSYYKYKPLLTKAQEFARRKMLKNALNYYRVIKSQNIPPELKRMINRNITDITEFLEKYLMTGG